MPTQISAPLCKICHTPSQLLGPLAFSRNCESARGRPTPPFASSRREVTYWRCPSCGLIFTPDFDHFSPADLAREIYNDDYIKVDPDYPERRPAYHAQLIRNSFPQAMSARILDYGAGSGRLGELLRTSGFANITTFDPFVSAHQQRPGGKFDLILCFEVAEHSPQPIELFSDLASLLADPGLILFSTLLQPTDIEHTGLGWWYIAPRNGHVTIYSRVALEHIARAIALNFASAADGLHILYRHLPTFAQHLLA